MPLRTVVLLVVLAAVALFAALNWSAILAPTTLSLGVAQVQAPLGLIMLGLIAVLAALFLAYVAYLQSTVLLEARRHARELEAGAARFTELRGYLETRLSELENSLSAEIGEMRGYMRDRLER